MSEDMEPIVIRQVEKRERKRRFAFPNVTTALLAVIATCLIVMVLQGFAILHQERRQSCAMRWTYPLIINPPVPGAPMHEAQSAWYVATLQCFGVVP